MSKMAAYKSFFKFYKNVTINTLFSKWNYIIDINGNIINYTYL